MFLISVCPLFSPCLSLSCSRQKLKSMCCLCRAPGIGGAHPGEGPGRGGKRWQRSPAPALQMARDCELGSHLGGEGPRPSSAQRFGDILTKSGTAPKLFPEKWETGELGQGLSQHPLTQGCCKHRSVCSLGIRSFKISLTLCKFPFPLSQHSPVLLSGVRSQQTPEQRSQRNRARLPP